MPDDLCPSGHRFLVYLHDEKNAKTANATLDRMFPAEKTKDAVLVEVRDGYFKPNSGPIIRLNGYRVYVPIRPYRPSVAN